MGSPASIAFRSPEHGIAAGGDINRPDEQTDNVVATSDGGKSWTVAGRPPFPGAIYGIGYVPNRPGTVVAVSPKGAAWSSDEGRTWHWLDQNDYWGIGFARDGTGWITGAAGRITRLRFAPGS